MGFGMPMFGSFQGLDDFVDVCGFAADDPADEARTGEASLYEDRAGPMPVDDAMIVEFRRRTLRARGGVLGCLREEASRTLARSSRR